MKQECPPVWTLEAYRLRHKYVGGGCSTPWSCPGEGRGIRYPSQVTLPPPPPNRTWTGSAWTGAGLWNDFDWITYFPSSAHFVYLFNTVYCDFYYSFKKWIISVRNQGVPSVKVLFVYPLSKGTLSQCEISKDGHDWHILTDNDERLYHVTWAESSVEGTFYLNKNIKPVMEI